MPRARSALNEVRFRSGGADPKAWTAPRPSSTYPAGDAAVEDGVSPTSRAMSHPGHVELVTFAAPPKGRRVPFDSSTYPEVPSGLSASARATSRPGHEALIAAAGAPPNGVSDPSPLRTHPLSSGRTAMSRPTFGTSAGPGRGALDTPEIVPLVATA